jgi:ABC-type transporter MlaC component
MKMKRMLMCLLLVAVVNFSGCSSAGSPDAETAAVEAARDWLSLVDAEKYAQSWEEAAQLFKGAVPKEQWVQTMQAARSLLVKTSRENSNQNAIKHHYPGHQTVSMLSFSSRLRSRTRNLQ